MTRRLRCQFVDQGSPESHRFLSLLEGAGYEVVRSFSSEAALAEFPRLQPDILLLIEPALADSALAVARGVRATPFGKQTPVLLLASKSAETQDHDWQEAGCDAVLDLPCSDRQFVQAVEAVLRERGVSTSRLYHQSDLADMDEELSTAMQSIDDEEDGPAPLLDPVEPAAFDRPARFNEIEPPYAGAGGAPSRVFMDPLAGRQPGLPPGFAAFDPAASPMRRAPATDQALRLRTVVTLGAGALIAGASVAFLVWLLVYTGFEGSEARPVVPRVDETAANPAKKQHGESPEPVLGGPAQQGDEAGDTEDEPGANPLLLNPYSAAPTLLLPMGPQDGGDSSGGDDSGTDDGGDSPDGGSPENG